MKQYEVLFVVKPTLTQEEIASEIANVKASIEKDGGEIVIAHDMGMKKLAYEVAKANRGYYTVFYFNANPSSIIEMERLIRLNENILKFMTVKYESKREQAAFDRLVKKVVAKKAPAEAPVATEAPAEAEAAVETEA
jgi:small subunit ribosomal protein S6